MAVRKNEEKLFNLNKTQEVLYQREFKKAEQMYRQGKR
ncbi:MAG: YfhE family protein [Bacillaceae bacterium]|nr:YfhE family protein [Bacillaceae bacterium]